MAKTPKQVSIESKLQAYDRLCRDSEVWYNQIQRLKEIIVQYEYSGGMYIPTQTVRKVIGWESGKNYRMSSTGGGATSSGQSEDSESVSEGDQKYD